MMNLEDFKKQLIKRSAEITSAFHIEDSTEDQFNEYLEKFTKGAELDYIIEQAFADAYGIFVLHKGYWGGGSMTYANSKNDIQAFVHDGDGGLPEVGGAYTISIYDLNDDSNEELECHDGESFDLDRVTKESENMINKQLDRKDNIKGV